MGNTNHGESAVKGLEKAVDKHRQLADKLDASLPEIRSMLGDCESKGVSNVEASAILDLENVREKHRKIANKLSISISHIKESRALATDEVGPGGLDPIFPFNDWMKEMSIGDACEQLINFPIHTSLTRDELFIRIRQRGGRVSEPKSLAPILSKDDRFVSVGNGRWATKSKIEEMKEMIDVAESKTRERNQNEEKQS